MNLPVGFPLLPSVHLGWRSFVLAAAGIKRAPFYAPVSHFADWPCRDKVANKGSEILTTQPKHYSGKHQNTGGQTSQKGGIIISQSTGPSTSRHYPGAQDKSRARVATSEPLPANLSFVLLYLSGTFHARGRCRASLIAKANFPSFSFFHLSSGPHLRGQILSLIVFLLSEGNRNRMTSRTLQTAQRLRQVSAAMTCSGHIPQHFLD